MAAPSPGAATCVTFHPGGRPMPLHQLRGRRRLAAALLLLPLPLLPLRLAASPEPAKQAAADPSALPSEIMPRAVKSLLLDLVATPAGFFAVGERGHILQSTDGRAWIQANVPTRSTLTRFAAVSVSGGSASAAVTADRDERG